MISEGKNTKSVTVSYRERIVKVCLGERDINTFGQNTKTSQS